jgi:endonuclease/exonuclease/phosphatase family metal-dependent hydrolase
MWSPSQLRFLSWNLAMMDTSAQAPPGWEQEHTEAAIRDAVLRIEPDVICYQELPGLVPFVETHRMFPASPESHSGNLAMLVTPRLYESRPRVQVVGDYAILATFDSALTIANVHFVSGRAGEERRRAQLLRVVSASPTDALLIVGDTNMRMSEVDEELGGLSSPRPPAPTWDSRANRFRDDAPKFTAYFTRWFATHDVVVSEVGVLREPVRLRGATFHLSDHFALTGTVGLRTVSAPPAVPPHQAD